MSFAQNGEDLAVAAMLPDVGRVLDIGANDGVKFSNSRHFLLKGWAGVLIEADARHAMTLRRLYGMRPDVGVIEAAVVPASYDRATVEFYVHELPGIGSCVGLWPEHSAKWGANRFGAPVEVRALRPERVQALGCFDLVSLDIEGGNLDVALGIDWGALCSGVAIIEHDGQVAALQEHLGPAFRLELRTSENAIFRRVP